MLDLFELLVGDNDLAMAKTTEQPDLVNRFKELWINERMPTFKKDLLTELKTEIAKQVKFVTERPTKIYINESLTAYRRRLFGKINSFKNTNKWKYLWTTNGTIHLRQTDSSQTFHFDTMEDFEEFANPQKDKQLDR